MAIVTAATYFIKKPNKVEKEACDKLQDTMAESQSATIASQEEMSYMGEELMTLSDDAAAYNEEANDEIEDQKTEYDMYMETYTSLKEKAESGQMLTDEEKSLYSEVVGLLTESGALISEIQEDASDTVTGIYDDMGTYQEGYDYAAETVAEVQGVTDYAESFDKSTQALCYVEGAAQTLNAVSGAIAGARLMAGGWWNWALGIASIAAGVSSGVAAAEQFKYAGEVGTEIEARKVTQDVNTETGNVYDTEIDNYDAWMTGVEDLELEIPDEIEAPEDTELPEGATTGAEAAEPISTGFGLGIVPEDSDKMKEEEKAKSNKEIS